jgi:hypothetical protein
VNTASTGFISTLRVAIDDRALKYTQDESAQYMAGSRKYGGFRILRVLAQPTPHRLLAVPCMICGDLANYELK